MQTIAEQPPADDDDASSVEDDASDDEEIDELLPTDFYDDHIPQAELPASFFDAKQNDNDATTSFGLGAVQVTTSITKIIPTSDGTAMPSAAVGYVQKKLY